MLAQRRTRRRGFTLMEVLLVLAILVILGAMVGVAFTRMQRRGYEDSARIQVNTFDTAMAAYYRDLGEFPANLEDLRDKPSGPHADRWRGPYVDKPIPNDPWGRPYQYATATDEYEEPIYIITSLGADGQEGNDDISNREAKK